MSYQLEFHDILHGHVQFNDGEDLTILLRDLINSPEVNRLRNMRQMNFDVPLIQELGRSRRLPHSIGVAHIAIKLAKRCRLNPNDSKVLVSAAILHDAAIPPYGHLVESEFKAITEFRHERRVNDLIKGMINASNKYMTIVPRKSLQLSDILDKHGVDKESVIELVCPPPGSRTPISADLDIDNIDNVHRMAAMLGWPGAIENVKAVMGSLGLNGLGPMRFSSDSKPHLEKWLDYRQRIYTLIIAHPECIPHNALQVDLVRVAVKEGIISPNHWYLSEPEFEEALRRNEKTKALASQLISGCEYNLVDYVWFKGFSSACKLHNAEIVRHITDDIDTPQNHGYFVWNERRLISRKISLEDSSGIEFGMDSESCLIALVKKTEGRSKWTKSTSSSWRRDVTRKFMLLFDVNDFHVDFPETYTGDYLGQRNNELQLGYR